MKIADFAFDLPSAPLAPVSETLWDSRSLEERFLEVVSARGGQPALADACGAMTYAELEAGSAAIARFILARDLAPETPIGVMCSRNRFFVEAALGVLRAGAVYVPLDPGLPFARRQQMLKNCAAPLLITDAAHAGEARRLQYACPSLAELLCPDVREFDLAIEKPGELMSLELWNHVTAEVADGSWKSYFDGRPLDATQLETLVVNLLNKTDAALAGGQGRVLDIGSGAGVVARALIARCAHYTAVDLSRRELDRLEALALETGAQVETHQMEAIDIHLLAGGYDLVTLNSVTENFPGYNYLRCVLDHALVGLKDGGVLFLGGVWDLAKKPGFLSDLREYAKGQESAVGLVRLEAGQELFVPRAFFDDWARGCGAEVEVSFSRPEVALRELADYRFDVVIRKGSGKRPPAVNPSRHGAAALSAAPPAAMVSSKPHAAAYIIYTSGSTGMPKGVVVEHGSLLNLTDALLDTIYAPRWAKAAARVALLASFSFDASLQQISASLLGGHTLHVVSDELKKEPAALHAFLEERHIDVCDGTPSLFALLTDYWLDHAQTSHIGTFILGGETLRADHLTRFFSLSAHGASCIFNAYGPTECCVDATLHRFDAANHRDYVVPPIGRPLPHTSISVRGRTGEVLPTGIPGDLWITGAGVARGYLGDPELTENRFVTAEGRRWYRTGDIVRCQHDGLLFFVGREDQQVKVGGYRVELGEVEAALNNCPMIRQAVVRVADFGGNGVNTLAAYFVSAGDTDGPRIRAYLANHLPAYAIPSYFISLEHLPVTSSGKIDRMSLPSPIQARPAEKPRRAPSGAAEEKLAGLWAQLLGRPIDDAEADFFELGGHSVLGIRLISLIEKACGQRLSLSQLFRSPTIAGLARALTEKGGSQGAYTPVIPLATETTGVPIFLFHPVGGSVFCYRPLADLLADRHPIYAVEAPGFSADWPQMPSVEAMAESYLDQIQRQTSAEEIIFGGWSFGGLVAFEAARQFRARGGKLGGLILIDTVADNRITRELMQQGEAAMLARLFSEQLPVSEEDFRRRTGDERLDYLVRLGVEHGMLPSGFTPQQMRRLLQTFHNNTLASARYEASPLPGRALLIRPQQASASALTLPDDPLQGWESRLPDGIELRWVRGTHESMLTDQLVGEIAAHIRAYLS